jgi:4-diphosphocytidyl-2-C-methyl-D-erythritol kinase
MTDLERLSPCKVNLVLNVLGKREDGFHELETVMLPVPLHDRLHLSRTASGIVMTCSDADLPVDASNLVVRAAHAFFARIGKGAGVRIHLEKNVPMQAGMGGGSANAAVTLTALNELFDQPLDVAVLHEIAADLGSDVPFFLEAGPALASGRGERIARLAPFELLSGKAMAIVHPGFGVPTGWAYGEFAKHSELLNGRKGRAEELVATLISEQSGLAFEQFYNVFEQPVFSKYPVLQLIKQGMKDGGAVAALMGGSGSAVFGIFDRAAEAECAVQAVCEEHGPGMWRRVVDL